MPLPPETPAESCELNARVVDLGLQFSTQRLDLDVLSRPQPNHILAIQ